MTKNLGTTDRTLRALFALVIAVLWLTGAIGGILALVLGVVAAVFAVTAALGTCPLYLPLHISTNRGAHRPA